MMNTFSAHTELFWFMNNFGGINDYTDYYCYLFKWNNDALKVSGTEIVEKLNDVEWWWLLVSGQRCHHTQKSRKKTGHCYDNTFVHTTSSLIFYTFVPTNVQLLVIDVAHHPFHEEFKYWARFNAIIFPCLLIYYYVQYNLIDLLPFKYDIILQKVFFMLRKITNWSKCDSLFIH